jgi:predicted RNA-binding Zn ribbon-like protein
VAGNRYRRRRRRGAGAGADEARRLATVVDLANARPVDGWTAPQLTAFRRRLGSFLRGPGGVAAPGAGARQVKAWARCPMPTLAGLQAWSEVQLGQFADEGRIAVSLGEGDVPLTLEVARGSTRARVVAGPVLPVFALGVALLLASPAGARLRRCPDQGCGRFFVRRGRMEHCSARCSRRVYMRKWRTV